jgi:hypothetical protein
MESHVTIKATISEMGAFFDNDELCSVRYYNLKDDGTFDTRIRHPELSKRLSGTFTIKGFKAAVKRKMLNK